MPTLAALRQTKGWTPAQLAHHAGVDEQVVLRIESGTVEQVSRGNRERLAAALHVHPSNVTEFRPSLGLTALGETGAGVAAKTGAPPSDASLPSGAHRVPQRRAQERPRAPKSAQERPPMVNTSMTQPRARTSAYDGYPAEYAAYVARREAGGVEGDPMGILPQLLALLGDVAGRAVLDAGCGDGYLARVLAARGAHVTGIDLAPRLVELARARDPDGAIEYRVADLSAPLPDLAGQFDAVASYLVLNDVEDHRGFAATLATALKPGGRAVFALNNPYGAVIRRHVTNYFDSGVVTPYRGLWAAGIKVYHYHRTLEEYLDAFLEAGLRLMKLADLSGHLSTPGPDTALPEGARFPRFMLLAFEKP